MAVRASPVVKKCRRHHQTQQQMMMSRRRVCLASIVEYRDGDWRNSPFMAAEARAAVSRQAREQFVVSASFVGHQLFSFLVPSTSLQTKQNLTPCLAARPFTLQAAATVPLGHLVYIPIPPDSQRRTSRSYCTDSQPHVAEEARNSGTLRCVPPQRALNRLRPPAGGARRGLDVS